MRFSASVCHSFWDSLEPGSAHCSAMGEGCTVAELMWLCCREKWESDPFQKGSMRTPGSCIHHWPQVSFWGAAPQSLHNFKGIPPPCFSLPSGLDTGVRHTALGLALWELQAERTTRNKRSMRQHLGLSSQHTRGWSFARSQAAWWLLLLSLKIQDNTSYKGFCAKRSQHHVHKIPSQVQQWNHPLQQVACTREKKDHIHIYS